MVENGVPSEFPVVVLPFAFRGNLLRRVPVFRNLSTGNPEQIVKCGMHPGEIAFADTQHETALGKDPAHVSVNDLPAAVLRYLQRSPEGRRPVRQAWVVLDQVVGHELLQPVVIAADQHGFHERPDQRPVGVSPIGVFGLDRPVHHAAARCVGAKARLDVVPVFHRLTVFEAEHLEPDAAGREIVLRVPEHEIVVFERADHVHSWRGLRQPFEQGGQPLAAFVGLGIVLDVFRFVDDLNGAGIAGLDAFQQCADTILKKLLEDELPDVEEIYARAAEAMRNGQLVPVYFGSAEKYHGIRRVLKALRHEAPQPVARAESLGFEPDAEATVQVFKTYHAQHSGKVSLARVWSGTVTDGQTLGGNRIGGMQKPVGANTEKISSAGPGDVVGLGRMENVHTGDVLTGAASEPDRSHWSDPLRPVYALAIAPVNRNDEVRLATGLHRLQEEDPSLIFRQNDDTHELVLHGQGDIHLQIALEKLENKYNVTTMSSIPDVPYRETIRKPGAQHARFKHKTGGHGMFGDVHVEIEPRPRGSGIEFADRIVVGAVPKQYIPAVEAGVKEFATEGPLGFPVVDFAVTLTDGQFHAVDSNEMSFKLAARQAMSEGLPKCAPGLLEPVVKVAIDVPSEYTSKVHGLVSGRRDQILGFEAKEDWKGWDSLYANMPESEIHDLIIELRSLTQGVGTYTAEFDHLQEISGRLADRIVVHRAEARGGGAAH